MRYRIGMIPGAVLLLLLLLAACGNPAGSGSTSVGNAEFAIVVDSAEPLSVTLAADPASPLPEGQEITVSATVTGGVGLYTYRWYLDGSTLTGESDSAVTVGADLPTGRYRLTMVASDGQVLGSDSAVFDVVP